MKALLKYLVIILLLIVLLAILVPLFNISASKKGHDWTTLHLIMKESERLKGYVKENGSYPDYQKWYADMISEKDDRTFNRKAFGCSYNHLLCDRQADEVADQTVLLYDNNGSSSKSGGSEAFESVLKKIAFGKVMGCNIFVKDYVYIAFADGTIGRYWPDKELLALYNRDTTKKQSLASYNGDTEFSDPVSDSPYLPLNWGNEDQD